VATKVQALLKAQARSARRPDMDKPAEISCASKQAPTGTARDGRARQRRKLRPTLPKATQLEPSRRPKRGYQPTTGEIAIPDPIGTPKKASEPELVALKGSEPEAPLRDLPERLRPRAQPEG
jgi:hypothetical protein